MDRKYLFSVQTPLGIEVRITEDYWSYLISIKHPVMLGKEDIVQSVLVIPDEIRLSKTDKDVFLYYKRFDKLYCVVAKHTVTEGYVITAYPTEKIKEGETIWTR
ncbi:DUF4258 domain-containing protein [Candidatus Magnetomonas plexicatena]|uniref:DUF4258 domain-containing protein n=1 Tax=Candidatus Magnetomonas plexicatena TaxID=2552947 RepID=UPI001C75501E|nr:DUF4258 domain-containing protein [Nitrospirales bacterium LBB_01]